ncbi:MAG: DUF1015 family protein [Candidatus Thermoplasmatota archaeon]|nr:DUF1015 family protein [Candidatus Thermoplasmatota archaeon]
MVSVKEFEGIRPVHPEKFCIKPYDVISKEEEAQLRKSKNAIHIILPEGEGNEVYENAKNAFKESMKHMVRDEPCMYLYREGDERFSQRGFILTVSLHDYEQGRIKKHEETREKPLNDRIKHIEATNANTGLVWTIFKSKEGLKKIMDEIVSRKPIFDFNKYGYSHKLWKIDNDTVNKIKSSFAGTDLYIADGHHRMRAAYEYMKRHENEEVKYVMIFVASDDEVRILPYNRVVKRIDKKNFIKEVEENFEVNRLEELKEPGRHEIQIYWNNEWRELLPREIPDGSVESLDVSILQNKLLGPILEINDVRNNPNIFFVGGAVPRSGYEQLVKEEGNAAVFYLHPTSIDELERVADEGRSMPPKSTWFDPKLLTGLVFHSLR